MIIDKEAARKASNALDWLRENQESIERIIGVVQKNQEFFNARLGDNVLVCAADKLEELVKLSPTPRK